MGVSLVPEMAADKSEPASFASPTCKHTHRRRRSRPTRTHPHPRLPRQPSASPLVELPEPGAALRRLPPERVIEFLVPPVGPWRSWERASMASRRSWVRIPSAPPTNALFSSLIPQGSVHNGPKMRPLFLLPPCVS